jgi:hypothetical protein
MTKDDIGTNNGEDQKSDDQDDFEETDLNGNSGMTEDA